MKLIILSALLLFSISLSQAQQIKFDQASPYAVSEEKQDKKVAITFTVPDIKAGTKVTVTVNEVASAAEKNKDYVLGPTDITPDAGNKGEFDITIKTDNFPETPESVNLTFSYKDSGDKAQTYAYIITILDQANGQPDAARYTPEETEIIRHLSFEVFTGGNLDFFNHLKFNDIGGELMVNANDVFGKDTRFGGFFGISNFQNFSLDSSNRNVRVQRIRTDTGAYVNGKTSYTERTMIDHKKLSTSEWSYYINPTYRLNTRRSDFFNIYFSLRFEVLRTSTETEFLTDTISTVTTTRPLGNAAVFQSGTGFLLQKAVDVQTNHFYSIGFPMFLNAQNKFKVYVDPNIGFTSYAYASYVPDSARTTVTKYVTSKTQGFALMRLRFTEQFTGLNITFGGEIRDVIGTYQTTINAYLGIRVNIGDWFSKPTKPGS